MSSEAWSMAAADQCIESEHAVLDFAHLRRYTMGNTELERELIALFQAQLPALLAQLCQAASAAEWKLATHTLKGSARVIGAGRIGEIAAGLEVLGLNGNRERRDRLVRALDEAVAEFDRRAAMPHP